VLSVIIKQTREWDSAGHVPSSAYYAIALVAAAHPPAILALLIAN
jgi:hypothetical protein